MLNLAKKLFNKSHFPYVFLLILLSILSHREWFSVKSIITWGDWYYWPSLIIGKLAFLWNPWISFLELGYPNIQLNYLFFTGLWSVFFNLGINYDFSSKLTFFIPIAILSFVSPYFLIYRLIPNKLISFSASLFYATTTYGMFVQPPIQFVYSLAPTIILLFMLALEKRKLHNWLLFNLVFWIGVCYEPRIMLLVSSVLFIVFLSSSDLRQNYKYLSLSFFLQIGLNFFWIFPTLFNGASYQISQITSRSIFGEGLFDITHSFTLYNWLWTGGYPNKEFIQQEIEFYFWFFPFLAFSVFLFKEVKNRKIIMVFALISLIGIFLSKQSSLPLQGSYSFMYQFLPGFSLFREASKFYIFVALGYLGLIAYSLQAIRNKYPRIFILCLLFLFYFCLINLKPLINNDIGTLFVSRSIPSDYELFRKFLNDQDNYSRTLWVPTYSRWASYNDMHPAVSSINLLTSSWEKNVEKKDPRYTGAEIITNFLRQSNANQLLDEASLKYVVIPIEDNANDDNFLSAYGKDRRYYIEQLEEIPYLRKINIGTKDLVIFENEKSNPHIVVQALGNQRNPEYRIIGPDTYQFVADKGDMVVRLSEAYNPNWRLRVGVFDWFNSLYEKDYYLPETNHRKSNAGLNEFKLNNAQEGQIITIFFQNISHFYFGLMVSFLTLVFVVGVIFIKLLKKILNEKT